MDGKRASAIKNECAEINPIRTAKGAAYKTRRILTQRITLLKVFGLPPISRRILRSLIRITLAINPEYATKDKPAEIIAGMKAIDETTQKELLTSKYFILQSSNEKHSKENSSIRLKSSLLGFLIKTTFFCNFGQKSLNKILIYQ